MIKYKYIFVGSIYPKRVNFNLIGLPIVELQHPDFNIEGSVTIKIVNSKLKVTLITEKEFSQKTEPNLETLKNVIEQFARAIVDTYCFVNSYSYDVDIEKVTCKQLSVDYTFGVVGEWNLKKTNEDSQKEFIRLLNLALSGKYPNLNYILSDFRLAIKYPSMTPGFCFRSLESIRKYFFNNRWSDLNSTLGFTETDHKFLTDLAQDVRHGTFPALEYKTREKCLAHLREVINKLVEHLEK